MKDSNCKTPETRSVSHALLDKALEVLDKDPGEWRHADDLFMLSLYGGANKHKVATAFSGAQLQDKMYGRVIRRGKEAYDDGHDVPEVHPQIVAMRAFLAAWVDWDRLLAPLHLADDEVSASFAGAKAKWRRKKAKLPELLRQ